MCAGLGCGELSELAIRNQIPSLKYVLFAVDADSDVNANKTIRECGKRFVLPGGGLSPEESIYDFLFNLSDEDPFWTNSRQYTKLVFLKRYQTKLHEFDALGGKKKRKLNKEWLKEEKERGFWGKNGVDVYKLWAADHQEEIKDFCMRLEKKVDGLIRMHEHESRL